MDALTKSILAFDSWLSSLGAQEWDIKLVAATSGVIFLSIRLSLGQKYKVDWDAFVHAFLTSVLSTMSIIINFSAVEQRGVAEPIGSILCHGALTNIHRLTPALTQGYAICDIINGFTLGPAALAHGIATLAVMTFFNEVGASHIITPILFMEISTTILALLKATFFSPTMVIAAQVSFALSFMVCRMFVTPYIMWQTLKNMLLYWDDFTECYTPYLFYATLIFSIFFSGLNSYWFYKIVQKIMRKVSGKEKLNDLERK